MNIKDKFFSNFVLLVALALSSIAAWYSIIGLTAIFAGAVVPVIIMGSALEVAKIATTVWLRKYWKRAGWVLKLYLVPAVVALALLTSMGIFGFLSKAHLDQGVPTGDVAAKVALLDEKIKTERDNIEVSKKALQQMDAQVDQMLGRTDTDRGAERAVRWVIILLVIVFDPLAIALVLAANASKEWDQLDIDDRNAMAIVPPKEEDIRPWTEEEIEALNNPVQPVAWPFPSAYPPDDGPLTEEQLDQIQKSVEGDVEPLHTSSTTTIEEQKEEKIEPEVVATQAIDPEPLPGIEEPKSLIAEVEIPEQTQDTPQELETEGVTKEAYRRIQNTDYVEFEGKRMHERVLQDLRPDFFELKADDSTVDNVSFGTQFPEYAALGDVYVRVDTLPNRVFKFNGRKWIEVNRENSETYLNNTKYLQYLIDKISTGEFDPEMLTDMEQDAVAQHIRQQRG